MDKQRYYEDRAENIMPSLAYRGTEIAVIKAEQWYKSRIRIIAILKTLSRIGKKYKAQKQRIEELEEELEKLNRLKNIQIREAIEACCSDELDKAIDILEQVLKGE